MAIIVMSGQIIVPAPVAKQRSSTSLEVLRQMAHHGEGRRHPDTKEVQFLPMPKPSLSNMDQSVNDAFAEVNDHDKAKDAPSLANNSQAKLFDSGNRGDNSVLRIKEKQKAVRTVVKKPTIRTAAVRRPVRKPPAVYVENQQFGFFGTW